MEIMFFPIEGQKFLNGECFLVGKLLLNVYIITENTTVYSKVSFVACNKITVQFLSLSK